IGHAECSSTVSHYTAWEGRWTNEARGPGHTLHVKGGKFGGVLNGIDYDRWNPEIDGFIPWRYTAETIEQKCANKDALRDRLLLRKEFKPVVAYVGRIDQQKGVHLIHHAIFHALTRGAQCVLLCTSPDSG